MAEAIEAQDGARAAARGLLGTYIVLGLLQGIALWQLARFEDPLLAAHPALLSAAVHFALATPVLWYLLAGSMLRPTARACVAAAIGLLLAGLGAHATAAAGPGPEPASYKLAAAVLSYMLLVLASGFDARRRWFDYARLFEHGWRNALMGAVAGALTGVLWVVLWGAAFLLDALGIHTLSRWLDELAVISVLSATAFAFFMFQATLRADALVALRKFWLALNTGFLPLALLLALVWVAALAATGPRPLFETRRAALSLFWFVALSLVFMNAAYQDGRTAPYVRWMAKFTQWSWLTMPVLAAVGLWALSIRVSTQGWTVERLWAAVVGAMALVYGIGYSASVLRPSRWMSSLETTNLVAALALSLTIVLLIGPVADLRKIAVASQVARMRSGHVSPADFDLPMLQREGGRWGRDALEQLAADSALSPETRTAAKDLLATGRVPLQGQDPAAALARLQGELRVLPSGAVPDAKLLALFSRRYADWNETNCTRAPAHCALWVTDLDGDGVSEAVLLSEADKSTTAVLYAKGDQGWRREGQLAGATNSLEEWIAAIDAKRVSPAKPRWPELQVGAKRYTVQR